MLIRILNNGFKVNKSYFPLNRRGMLNLFLSEITEEDEPTLPRTWPPSPTPAQQASLLSLFSSLTRRGMLNLFLSEGTEEDEPALLSYLATLSHPSTTCITIIIVFLSY
jgi:hypothetical protein